MVWSSACKLLQRQTYSVLSHRYGSLLVLVGLLMVIVSALQFGEVALEWSKEKYAAVFNSFSDNVAGRSFQSRLCLPVPIDVVYTWVNGTDPRLLVDLRRFKMQLETELNETRSGTQSPRDLSSACTFTNCVPSNQIVVNPPLPETLTLPSLTLLYPALLPAVVMGRWKTGGDDSNNVTVFTFDTVEHAQEAQKSHIRVDAKNATVKHGYFTTDWTLPGSILLSDTILMTGFPHTLSAGEIQQNLPERMQKAISKFSLHSSQGVAVLHIPDKAEFEYALQETNFTIDGKTPSLNAANLVWELEDSRYIEEIAASRFEDNEELRYSLRSIQRFAPWVRHVYIVTNGQIPAWLNLDCPRLTVVTHDEIFPNRSHLPTFGSPSIESHLHRIPGLSDKFIYLNDDVMFGREVWPDDFYTHAHGQKVYLTWPVPNCQDGCPSSWIRDGYCDKACNNSACEWDGGDCDGSNKRSYNVPGQVGIGGLVTDSFYCNSGCANNWIADRYCDPSCNVKICGFDAGDCGVANFHLLPRVDLDPKITEYSVTKGEHVAYFNLTAVFDTSCTLDEGLLEETPVIRSATLAQKFKVMTLVMYEKFNETTFNVTLKGKCDNDTKVEFCFNITVDPHVVSKNDTLANDDSDQKPQQKISENKSTLRNMTEGGKLENETIPVFKFLDVPEEEQGPNAKYGLAKELPKINMSMFELPDDVNNLLQDLLMQHRAGDLTDKGFQKHQSELWSSYMEQLKVNGEKPVLRTTPETLNEQEWLEKPAGINEMPNVHVIEENPVVPLEQQPEIVGNENVIEAKQLNPEKVEGQESKLGFDTYLQRKHFKDRNVNGVGLPNMTNLEVAKQMRNNVAKPPEAQPLHVQDRHEAVIENIQRKNIHVNNIINHSNFEKMEEHPNHVQMEISKKEDSIVDDGVVNVNKQEDHVNLQRSNQDIDRHIQNEVPNVQIPVADVQDKRKPMEEGHFKSRKLNQIAVGEDELGFLPWERMGVFAELQKKKDALLRQESYNTGPYLKRQPLDTFADSLRHVNKLFNKAYGYTARKVPAHMPHMVDKHLMFQLQARFPVEWDVTSSHRIRSSTDMQFAFSYYYFLMEEPMNCSVEDFFKEMDVDRSGVLSDREIRTMATRLYDLPLDLQTLTGLEKMLVNCSLHLESDPDLLNIRTPPENYYDKEMPQITKYLVVNCGPIGELIHKHIKSRPKYKFEVVGDEQVAFKMIRTNVSHVVGQLDDVRKNPKKFVCLNDNIDHTRDDAKTVKAVLTDFYESLFPEPSIFELPREYRNRFLHMDELREWRKYRDWLKLWTHIALFVLIVFSLASFFGERLDGLRRKLFGRRVNSETTDSSNGNEEKIQGQAQSTSGCRTKEKLLVETV